jgi:outer membrane immunogenic protein
MSVRTFLALGIGVACCGGAAMDVFAADMPGPGPSAYAAPLSTWTGFYIGVHGGGAWDPTGGHNTNCGTACTTAAGTITGALGGLQVGYNHQFGALVLGAEADFSASSLRGSYPARDGIDTVTSSVDYFGTLTGKIGAVVGNALVYGKGGAAWTHTNHSDFDVAIPATFTTSYWLMGWTVGGGIEYALTPNWSVKLEYDLIETPDKSTTFTAPGGAFFTASLHQLVNSFAGGVNYRF